MGSQRRRLEQLEELGVPADLLDPTGEAMSTLDAAGDSFSDALFNWEIDGGDVAKLQSDLGKVLATVTEAVSTTLAGARAAEVGK